VILSLNVSGSRPWPFWVMWRHRSRDRLIPYIWFPIGAPLELTLYLEGISRYWGSNVLGHFKVMWRHWPRDYSTRTMWFPISGLLIPSSYLLRLPRYFDVHVQYWAKHAYSRVNSHITHIVHALYHVIGLQGVKNNRIFGISDPNFPIHYATFRVLWWWLRVVYREHPHYGAFLVENLFPT